MNAVAAAHMVTPYGYGDLDLFAGCRPKELAAIDRLCTELAVAPGRVLLREGDPGNQFLVVTAGSARVDAGSRCLGRVEAGSFVGEMSMIDGGPCTATVTAVTPMHLLVFGRKDFDALLSLEIRSVTRRMLRTVARRLRIADLDELGEHPTPGSTEPSPPMMIGPRQGRWAVSISGRSAAGQGSRDPRVT